MSWYTRQLGFFRKESEGMNLITGGVSFEYIKPYDWWLIELLFWFKSDFCVKNNRNNFNHAIRKRSIWLL